VNDDGSVIATGLSSAKSLQLPSTAGLPQPSSQIELGLNLPAGAEILPQTAGYTEDNPYEFDRNDSDTFNKSTSITVYDSLGNPHIATVYYVKTSSATEINPTNKWDTKIFIGDKELDPSIIAAKNDKSETQYMNKFGEISTNPAVLDPTFNAAAAHPLYFNDDQQITVPSSPGSTTGGYMTRATVGHDFGSTDSNKVTIVNPTKEVDTITFGESLGTGGSLTLTKADATAYTQTFITSHEATLDALVVKINAGEEAFKASRQDGKITLTAYTSAALPAVTPSGTFSTSTGTAITTTNAVKSDTTPKDGETNWSLVADGGEHVAWPVEGTSTFSGNEFLSVSVDSSSAESIDIVAGSYSGTELATLMTRQLNAKFSDEKGYKMPVSTSERTITIELQNKDGDEINKLKGPEMDTLTFDGTVTLGGQLSFKMGTGTDYTQLFDTNSHVTLEALAAQINLAEADYAVKRVDDTLVVTSKTATALGDVTSPTGRTDANVANVINVSTVNTSTSSGTTPLTIVVDETNPDGTEFNREELVANVQAKVDNVTYIDTIGVGKTGLDITVGYDLTTRSLTFTEKEGTTSTYNSYKASSLTTVSAFGLESATATFSGIGNTFVGGQIVPTGAVELDAKQQRTGLLVTYSKDAHKFSFSSGTTGEESTITVGVPSGTASSGGTSHLLGIGTTYNTEIDTAAGTGLSSTSGTAMGSKAGVDITGTFSVTSNDNTISVTIDGVDGTVVVPSNAYTGHTFATAIQDRINLIQHSDGRQVNDVTVEFDQASQSFTVTSGTVGENSSVNINGHSNWGFDTTTQVRGIVPEVTVVTQATDTEGNLLYIDQTGKQTTQKPDSVPAWTPIYLDKGELTFDTYGKLISPKEGVAYSPFDPSNGSDLLTLGVDYGKFSTQYSAPFSVLSLSQDGYPSGQLDGLDIDSGGVVRANYTNGTQVALGKLMMANFANPNGLKQVGNANFVSTTNSGAADLGEAGSDGFGDIQGGALERANVDLTEELVNLITAQRNFQANAKAIETSSSLTQTIINIRG
jgi:flagellar hook-basal body protein